MPLTTSISANNIKARIPKWIYNDGSNHSKKLNYSPLIKKDMTIFNKKLKISRLEYDYSNAIEHINSIFNLVNIIRYNYKEKIIENFLPFKIKLIDLNLFYNIIWSNRVNI